MHQPALAVILAAATLVALPAPAQQQQPPLGQLDASPTLFTVMAAINAAGYDDGIDSPSNHPLRKAVREELAKRNIPSLPALKDFFAKHRKRTDTAELGQYLSFALNCSGPPDFAIRKREVEIPPDALALEELSPLLQAFYKEANIPDLWRRSQPAINQYLAIYHRPVVNAIQQVNAYLRETNLGYKNLRFQVLLELLAAPNEAQLRSYSGVYTLVLTPSAEVRSFDVRHAYLVFILDPLASRYQEILRRKETLRDHAMRAMALPDVAKEDFLVLTTESLVKAVESRLDHKPEMVDQALHQGYILTPYFAEHLVLYEKQEAGMRVFYPDLVGGIDLVQEDKRLSAVDFSNKAPERIVKVAPPPPAPLTGAAKSLDEAEQAYIAKDYEKANKIFLDLLQQTDVRAVHAKAYYGLARIATRKNDPETAERLFKKTLDLDPEPQDKAWTLVYLGKLSLLACQSDLQQGEQALADKDRDQALQYFQQALKVSGASEAATAEAQKSLQSISKP